MEKNLNTFWANIIIEELTRLGTDYFLIAPGSRSTPLVAAAARNLKAKTFICYDERGLAFHALGYAKAANKPAAVITTSGTAVANLLPAVTEASNASTPMILLTADRPQHLVDNGSNQTITQPSIFANFTRSNIDLPCPTESTTPETILAMIDQAHKKATTDHPGPVHINCRYKKPLEPQDFTPPTEYTKNITNWQTNNKPYTNQSPSENAGVNINRADKNLKSLAEKINKTIRGMIILGTLNTQEEQTAATNLIKKLNWPTYADITSQLRLPLPHSGIFRYCDQQILSEDFNKKATPDLVLHIGSRIVSKRHPEFFTQNRPADYIMIKPTPDRYDPADAVTQHIQTDITTACTQLTELIAPANPTELTNFYNEKTDNAQTIIETITTEEDFLSEPFIARQLSKLIPQDTNLFLANSMPIRDADLYSITQKENINVIANRGVSGIDGIISSAAGTIAATEKSTTLLIGDLSFIHDINALSTINNLPAKMIIVLINNQGGGIFNFLPISKTEDIFEKYFSTPHNFTFEGAAETFKIDYCKTITKTDFTAAYNKAINSNRSTIIETSTNKNQNLIIRKNIKTKIIKMLEQ